MSSVLLLIKCAWSFNNCSISKYVPLPLATRSARRKNKIVKCMTWKKRVICMFKEQRPIYIFSYKIKEWCHVVLDVIRSSGPESTNIEYDSLEWS